MNLKPNKLILNVYKSGLNEFENHKAQATFSSILNANGFKTVYGTSINHDFEVITIMHGLESYKSQIAFIKMLLADYQQNEFVEIDSNNLAWLHKDTNFEQNIGKFVLVEEPMYNPGNYHIYVPTIKTMYEIKKV